MTLDQFVSKYNGKKVEYHSYSSNSLYQCVDLANQYIVEVLGLSPIIGTNAQDFPTKRGKGFEWIVNTPTGLPQKGDLMIFKSADNVGHISIFLDGNLSLFRSFDQNYPTGSPSKIVQHNYRNVLGWLRPIMPKNTELDKCRVARDSWWNNQTKLTATVGVTGLTDANANDKVNEAVTKINQLKKDLDGATNQVKAKETEISRLTASLDGEKSANQALRTELQTFMEVLAGKLTTTVDKPNIIGAVEKLLTVEDDLLKARKDLESSERARKELEADKDRQIQGLKDEINQLRKANDELENRVDKQAEQIERLGKRLEELGSPVDPTPGLIARLKTLVTDFLDTWRKA